MLYPFILVILVSSVFFRPTFEPFAVISNVQRAKVPGNESSRERMFQGTKVPWNFRSRERKFQGTFVPGSESSRERKFQRTKVPPYGTFVPGSESSLERKFLLPSVQTVWYWYMKGAFINSNQIT